MASVSRWDSVLTDTARSVIPSDADLRFAKQIADQIFEILRTKSGYRIDRQYIAGSIGKGTAINIKPDYDCVIFVNNIRPPFESVIADFERVLTSNIRGIQVSQAKRPRKVLQFTIQGLDFDITPAINFSQNQSEQRRLAMQCINAASEGYMYSSCFTEFVVDFIKAQSAFVHDIIRLAKYWNKQVDSPYYISARSSIIECIAVQAGQSEEKRPYGRSIAVAFKAFLEMIENFPNLKIILSDVYGPEEIRHNISIQRPLIMDPANPYNNLAHSFVSKKHAMRAFQEAARVTLRRMENANPNRASLFTVR